MANWTSVNFRRIVSWIVAMRKVFVVCILIFCMSETCVSLAGKLLIPVTGLPKLSSLFPFDSDVCYRKPRNQILRNGCLKLALGRISDTEVSPDNISTTPSLEASLEKSDCIPSGYKDSSVLLVGDGDFSFAAALSSLQICRRWELEHSYDYLLVRLQDLVQQKQNSVNPRLISAH